MSFDIGDSVGIKETPICRRVGMGKEGKVAHIFTNPVTGLEQLYPYFMGASMIITFIVISVFVILCLNLKICYF
jgi:hypothetical protein